MKEERLLKVPGIQEQKKNRIKYVDYVNSRPMTLEEANDLLQEWFSGWK